MAKTFFTSDWHLGSNGIIIVAKRPFKTVEKMNDRIIALANMKAKTKSDIIVHVGDFCEYGDDNHYKNEECRSGLKVNPSEYVSKINATFVNIEGNHDSSNRMRSVCRSMMTSLGNFNNVSIGHYPSFDINAKGTFISYRNRKNWTVRLCGHVHTAWKYKFDVENRILNVNVGVDQWRFNIVSESEIIGFIGSIKNEIDEKYSK